MTLYLHWSRVYKGQTGVECFGCSVFEFWVLRFRSWVLRFRVLGASFSRFGCFVFEFWVLRASVFVFETTLVIRIYA